MENEANVNVEVEVNETSQIEPTQEVEMQEPQDDFTLWEQNANEDEVGELETQQEEEIPKEPQDNQRIDHEANEHAKKIRKSAMKNLNDMAAAMGFNDVDSVFEYVRSTAEERLKEAAIDGDESAIEDLANFRASQKIAQERNLMQAQADGKARGMEQVQRDIAEFGAAYPQYNVRSVEDVKNIPNAVEVLERLTKSNGALSLKDSFLLVNSQAIMDEKIKEAGQHVRNNIKSKDHLQSSVGNGSGEAISIPSDVLKEYMTYGFSREEAMADYKKNLKG